VEGALHVLIKYKDDHGDCNVNTETGGPLGEWVNTQRQSYIKGTLSPDTGGPLGKSVNNRREEYKNGNLSKERIEQLESLGFSWDPVEEAWQARFNELMQYKQQLGDCNVPTRESQLGNWVSTQRAFYKRGTLSPKRIEQLEAVGFEWVLREGGGWAKR